MRALRVVLLCGVVAALVQGTDARAQNGVWRPRSQSHATASAQSSKVLTVGELRRNPSQRNGAPPFILLKRDGSLRCLVTPAPGVDLRAYVGNRIGIRGRAGRVVETGVLHVRVERVSRLADSTPAGISRSARVVEPVLDDPRVQPAGPVPMPAVAASGTSRQSSATRGRTGRAAGRTAPLRQTAVGSRTRPVTPTAVVAAAPDRPRTEVQQMDAVGEELPPLAMPELIEPPLADGAILGGSPELGFGSEACATGQCTGQCQPACGPRCPCGSPWKYWVRAEYLLWWADGMNVPPLATTSPAGTPVADAGVLGAPGTTILFGGTDILKDDRSGGRILFGFWLSDCDSLGIEAEYFGLDTDTRSFSAVSDADGRPILARPFYNVNPRDQGTGDFDPPARNDSELVSYPDILAGGVSVQASSQLNSAGVRFLVNLACRSTDCQDPCGPTCGIPRRERLDMLLGYRYINLDERLAIREDLTSLDQTAPGRFQILDEFDTESQFNGLELGARWRQQRPRWFVEMLGKLALGNSNQIVHVNGYTRGEPAGEPATTATGGLLAQRTNIGRYARDNFAVVPEFGATLGYRLTQRLHATVGYTFVYWSRVVRPGDVIDLDVNPDLLPPEETPAVGLMRPAFNFVSTDYWAQGLNFGLDYRW